jgi:hypothetical protein
MEKLDTLAVGVKRPGSKAGWRISQESGVVQYVSPGPSSAIGHYVQMSLLSRKPKRL